jgi:hypothetical protein
VRRPIVLAAGLLAVAIAVLVVVGRHPWSSSSSGPAQPPAVRGPADAIPVSAAIAADSTSVRQVRIAGIPVLIAAPRHPNHRYVLFMHGAAESPVTDFTQPLTAPVIAALLGAGYGFADPETAPLNWGDPPSVQQDLAAAGYLQASGNRIVVMGDSMGGLDALQVLAKVDPVAFIGVYPVCNLATVAREPQFTGVVAAAHVSIPALSPVPIVAPSGLPVLLLASPQDTIVPKAQNADVCAAEARRVGMDVTEVTTSGEHADPSNWVPGRILGFLRRHVGA